MRTVRVYVAGSSSDIDTIEPLIAKLREAGVEITHDWTAVVRAHGAGNPDGLSQDQKRALAEQDLDGVRTGLVLWLVNPQTPTFGAGVEFGIALGAHIPIIVSGPHQRSIFLALALHSFETHEQALAFIVLLRRGQR